MLAKYDEAELRFLELELMLGDSAVVHDDDNYRQMLSEWRQLRPLFDIYQQYQALQANIADAKQLADSNDSEICELAREEITKLSKKRSNLELTMLWRLTPQLEDTMSVFVELNVDRDELFNHSFYDDFCRMYTRYLIDQYLNIRFYQSGYCGDPIYTEVFYIEEKESYRKLQFDHGIHRIIYKDDVGNLRNFDIYIEVVPHTKEDVETLDMNDVERKTIRCLGAGGMSILRYERHRLIHLPTGLTTSVTDTCSVWEGLIVSRSILASKVRMYQSDPESYGHNNLIRIYNTIENTVMDSRLPDTVFNLSEIQENGLGQIIEKLIRQAYSYV